MIEFKDLRICRVYLFPDTKQDDMLNKYELVVVSETRVVIENVEDKVRIKMSRDLFLTKAHLIEGCS